MPSAFPPFKLKCHSLHGIASELLSLTFVRWGKSSAACWRELFEKRKPAIGKTPRKPPAGATRAAETAPASPATAGRPAASRLPQPWPRGLPGCRCFSSFFLFFCSVRGGGETPCGRGGGGSHPLRPPPRTEPPPRSPPDGRPGLPPRPLPGAVTLPLPSRLQVCKFQAHGAGTQLGHPLGPWGTPGSLQPRTPGTGEGQGAGRWGPAGSSGPAAPGAGAAAPLPRSPAPGAQRRGQGSPIDPQRSGRLGRAFPGPGAQGTS